MEDKAKVALDEERAKLYSYLKNGVPENVKKSLYDVFGVDKRGKKRKSALMNRLWHVGNEDSSAEAILIMDNGGELSLSGTVDIMVMKKTQRILLDLRYAFNSAMKSLGGASSQEPHSIYVGPELDDEKWT